MTSDDPALEKRATGLSGLDAVTRGGLPARGTTLIVGGPGTGKTVFALQVVARAAEQGDASVFVSFEETPAQIQRDAASFRWGRFVCDPNRVTLIDARPPAEAVAAGGFDLRGLLAAIDAQVQASPVSWVVLDGIDRLLSLEPDVRTALDHVADLNEWCEQHGVSLILTGKRNHADGTQPIHLEGVEFLLSTIIVLSAELVGRRLNRRFRIAKYRGTGHVTDELALVMDDDGIHVPYDTPPEAHAPASTERIGIGIGRLDDVLGGGLYRGSTTLISGQPGTAKTTLAVAFALAAAERGERALFVSFDELPDRIVRNVASVGLDIQPQIDAGLCRFECREASSALIEAHYVDLIRLLGQFRPHALVIDPVSALVKAESAESAQLSTERLIHAARAQGITNLLTSLTESDALEGEQTVSKVSTLADTWIALSYHAHGGERNRALSVIKSRGTAHSNQVRELLLSDDGVDLADVYEYGSEVLLGTARLQKESEETERRRRERIDAEQRQRDLERRMEQARIQRESMDSEIARLETELETERTRLEEAERAAQEHYERIVRRRDPRSGRQSRNGEAGHGRST